jgi:hypothetical protein
MLPLNVHVPDANYHQNLISCQVACPVHTDARGYVRAIADGRFEEAYLIARGPNPFASIVLTTLPENTSCNTDSWAGALVLLVIVFPDVLSQDQCSLSHCQSSAEIN